MKIVKFHRIPDLKIPPSKGTPSGMTFQLACKKVEAGEMNVVDALALAKNSKDIKQLQGALTTCLERSKPRGVTLREIVILVTKYTSHALTAIDIFMRVHEREGKLPCDLNAKQQPASNLESGGFAFVFLEQLTDRKLSMVMNNNVPINLIGLGTLTYKGEVLFIITPSLPPQDLMSQENVRVFAVRDADGRLQTVPEYDLKCIAPKTLADYRKRKVTYELPDLKRKANAAAVNAYEQMMRGEAKFDFTEDSDPEPDLDVEFYHHKKAKFGSGGGLQRDDVEIRIATRV